MNYQNSVYPLTYKINYLNSIFFLRVSQLWFRDPQLSFFLKISFIYFQSEGKGGRVRERNINVWLPLMHPLLGTWPAIQAPALTGNRTSDPLVCRLMLHPLSHTSQGCSGRKVIPIASLHITNVFGPYYQEVTISKPVQLKTSRAS